MNSLGEYIAGRAESVPHAELSALVSRFGWFTTARRARALLTGENDPALILPLMFSPTIPPRKQSAAPPTKSLIDRFIEHGGYRIVPADKAEEIDVEIEIDSEMVTEELAEIYRAQGLTAEAEKIYHILSLRNS